MDDHFACQDIESIKSVINKFIYNSDELSVEDMSDLEEYFDSLENRKVDDTQVVAEIRTKLLQNKRIIIETMHNAIYNKH